MRLRDLLDLYDNWNNNIVINNDELVPILKCRIFTLYDNGDLDDFLDCRVVVFGFYDNELTVRIKEVY